MSTAETNKIVWIAEASTQPIDINIIEDWINEGVDKNWVTEVIRLHGIFMLDVYIEYAEKYAARTFPVRGQDLLDAGMKPGPTIGRIMSALKSEWKKSRYTLDRDQLMKISSHLNI